MLLIEPRPLSEEERVLLEFLLSADFPECESLRLQLASVSVEGACECGCGTVSPPVWGSSAAKAAGENTVPIEAYDDAVDVLLFPRDGFISSLEIVFYDDRLPRPFPKPSDLKLWKRPPHKMRIRDPKKASS